MPAGELHSWKEIAAYLKVTVRTAQRWEAERGLPVRRLPGERGRVVASTSELDRWRQETGEGPDWWNNLKLLRACAVVLTAAVVLSAAVVFSLYLTSWRPGPPAELRTEGRTLTVTDSQGRLCWRYTFPELLSPSFEGYQRTGQNEVLFAYRSVRGAVEGDWLYYFSPDGQFRWRFTPQKRAPFPERELQPPYGFRAAQVLPGAQRIAVSFVHHYAYPGYVALLESDGRVGAEYWHAGHLDHTGALDLDGDGVEELLLGGIDHQRRQAVLVVLDNQGQERALVRFPRTEVNHRLERFNSVRQLAVAGGRIRVTVAERLRDTRPFVVYTLDRNLRVDDIDVQKARPFYTDLVRLGVRERDLTGLDAEALRQGVEVVRP